MVHTMKQHPQWPEAGRKAICVRPAPGLLVGREYFVVGIDHHLIMGPLLVVRDGITNAVLKDSYYPWRFNLV